MKIPNSKHTFLNIMTTKRRIQILSMSAVAAILMASCGNNATKGAAFTGHINPADSIAELYFNFPIEGDLMNMRTIEIIPDSAGNFEFPDSIVPADGIYMTILADNGYFGFLIEPGKNAEGTISRNPDGELTMTFSGDNTDVNEYYNAYTGAFDTMKYFSPDPEEALSISKYMENLEKANADLIAKLPSVKDDDMREYLKRRTDRMYTWTKIRLLMDKAYEEDKDVKEYPDYVSLANSVDPNDDLSLECTLIFPWLNMQTTTPDSLPVEHAIEELQIIQDKVTNQRTRKAMFNQIPYTLYAYGNLTPEQGQKFLEVYCNMAKDYPELIDQYTIRTQALTDLKAGDKVPYDPTLVTPDGKSVKLSSLYGTPLYIDIWATWCGPCCKEIPHLEKLVEKMADFKGVRFISISTDSDEAAWKAKLEKDNPSWQQYLMPSDEADRFMQLCGINGIPRFMIIGADGTFINPDAQRPSDPELESTLRSL